MDTLTTGFQNNAPVRQEDLLVNGEAVVIVDDDPLIREPIRLFLTDCGMRVLEADSGARFHELLDTENIALALLDIGLPDVDGQQILPHIKERHPDTVVVMLTGSSDLQTALDCLRGGADDFIAKPASLSEIMRIAKKNLEKRRLIIQNRKYQEDLENANFRISLMHQLAAKMNSVYLNTVQLDEILQAILVGITANEGLRFNRAFLALIDEKEHVLQGRLAIGPGCREEADKIWGELQAKELNFFEIVDHVRTCNIDNENHGLNRLIKNLTVPTSDTGNILIHSALERKSIKVDGTIKSGFDLSWVCGFLGTDEFVVVPLYSPRRSLGVIIADNFITRRPISDGYLGALEFFSSQASLAIEHSMLYMDMEKTIAKLESLNYELDKNKDMLIEAERFSALGHMAAQLVHNIRNPITAVGGIARILAKKGGPEQAKYTDVMNKEISRLESTLEELFDFVSHAEVNKEEVQFYPLLQKVFLLLQADTNKHNIEVSLDFPEPDITLQIDQKLIRQMLVHLFKNAIEAMPDGGLMKVVVTRESAWLTIRIRNTGNMIDDEQIRKAKEPFYTTKSYGTGMGLTMVDRIVRAHMGNFTIGRHDTSTEVLVKLPL
nr:response regulator [Desulfobulbaceae bacterium]